MHRSPQVRQILTLLDHEDNRVEVKDNGDPARYGVFLEVSAGEVDATAHLTPEQMADLGRWLLTRVGML